MANFVKIPADALHMIERWAMAGPEMSYFIDITNNGIYAMQRDIEALHGSKSPKITLYYYKSSTILEKKSAVALTRLLKRLQPDAPAHVIRDHASRVVAELTIPAWEVKVIHAETPEEEPHTGREMARVYETCDFGSCMRKLGGISGNVFIDKSLMRHPIEVYAAPDIALIAILDTHLKMFRARAVVNHKKKTYYKIYPADRTGINQIWVARLIEWLDKQDYRQDYDSLTGCQIRNIQIKIHGSVRTLMPYIDVEACLGVRKAKSSRYITISKANKISHEHHTIALNGTNGYGVWRKGHLCSSCGEIIDGEELAVGPHMDEIVCEGCREEYYRWVESLQRYISQDHTFACYNCSENYINDEGNTFIRLDNVTDMICNSCVEENQENYTYVEARNLYFDSLHPEVGGPLVAEVHNFRVEKYLTQFHNNALGRVHLKLAQTEHRTTVDLIYSSYAYEDRIGTFKHHKGIWRLMEETSEERAEKNIKEPKFSWQNAAYETRLPRPEDIQEEVPVEARPIVTTSSTTSPIPITVEDYFTSYDIATDYVTSAIEDYRRTQTFSSGSAIRSLTIQEPQPEEPRDPPVSEYVVDMRRIEMNQALVTERASRPEAITATRLIERLTRGDNND